MGRTQNKRIKQKARRRRRRTKILVHQNRTALKLVIPGVSAQQSYGYVVNGASPSQTMEMRINIKGSTHLGGTGACLTSSIAWLFGPTADPGVKNFVEQLDAWVLSWAKLDATDRKETRRTWAIAVGEIVMGKSISHTKGPAEATIVALLQLGWKPSAPDRWEVDNNTAVKLNGEAYTRFQITARAQHDAQVKL